MGDAGVMGGAAADAMTLSGIQTSTGAKTFSHQKLKLGNSAGTFVATYEIPAITADTPTRLPDTLLTKQFKYLVFIDPNDVTTPYHAVNQITGLTTKNALGSSLFNTVFTDSANAAVFIADGTYLCLANITIPTGIQIIGQSRENTIIKADTGWAGGATNINFLTNANGGVNAGNSNILMANFTVDGNNLAKDCIHFDRVWRTRITNCHLKGSRAMAIWWWGDLSTDATPIVPKENQFDNNVVESATGTVDVFGGGRMTDSVIGPNNVFRDALVSGPSGIVVQTNPIRLLVTGNHIFNVSVTGAGISLEGGHHCTISNNVVHDIVGAGINLPMSPSGRGVEGSLTGNAHHCTITGNRIYNANTGISTTGHGHQINNNYIKECSQQGIASSSGGTDVDTNPVSETDPGQICNNVIINCGKNTGAGATTRAGIQINGSSGLVNNLIMGNTIYDNQTTHTMNYGIYESSPSDSNLIAFNKISTNMLVQDIRKIGTNTILLYNNGVGGGGGGTAGFAIDNDAGITNTDSPYTIAFTTNAVIRANATSGAITINLPTAVGIAGIIYKIYRTDIVSSTNLLTIDANSTETIDSNLTYILRPAEWIHIESDGANWQVIAKSLPSKSGYYFVKGTGATAANRRYSAFLSGVNAASTTPPAANTLWAIPFVVGKTTKFDTISFRVTTLSTAGNSRVGIYRDNGNMHPGALIFDSGAIDTSTGSTSAARDTTITSTLQTFQPDLYWLVYEQDTATGQYETYSGALTASNCLLGHDGAMGASNPGYGYSVASYIWNIAQSIHNYNHISNNCTSGHCSYRNSRVEAHMINNNKINSVLCSGVDKTKK